ncbi:cuticle protein AMP1A-like isoform X2 [Portunus trituberculatus]|uniref:Larval cuticle protein LCP-17 n=1 Tax=Portunus trituberculatus TaxID=210409 RepID=A0A5B7E507_PORTR|nr:cuticle protein AMP1A-like isoform X2 [Portunus trituberculatus]MPC29092.1 Larval cuticle protein LCP-17 [Portunus trituberculatus]
MKSVFLFAVAVAAFHLSLAFPADLSSEEDIPIVKDQRVLEDDGKFNFEIETGNGIRMSQGGSPDGVDGAVIHAGQYSYTAPDGTLVELKFVANENGFQPESALLPVAPEFPHPIPQFVLDQIAFAALQDSKDSDEDED